MGKVITELLWFLDTLSTQAKAKTTTPKIHNMERMCLRKGNIEFNLFLQGMRIVIAKLVDSLHQSLLCARTCPFVGREFLWL